MFSKILIANRGEIACRVIRTARSLGVRTVAVYSDADAQALHVEMADEAVWIGGAAASDSYLNGQRIVAAALATGAEAVHPGYGFLSENPEFVEAVEAAGLTFIGPPASAIRAMGLKDAAKRAMEAAGVPVVPGYHGDSQVPAFLAEEALTIGYPVLIKARAGGGGKGMRLVEAPADFAAALEGAQREGQASFGDPACLVEKFIPQPRHIEIQVFGDAHGNVVHLFERDCSLQRRHQKVIEEAPAPGMPQDVRAAMGNAAVEAARAIGYQGAGTVEFIVDGSGPLRTDGFWFMEMNTRLQVEHPVTEAITGLDLVALQLRVAAGEPLPFTQQDLLITGHSFEARLYAEDPAKGFLPATGRLAHLMFPDGVRVDTAVRAGDVITPHYDPMIAKLISHGPTRSIALARLTAALDATEVAGSTTNLAFLAALTRHEGFARGEVDTGLIGRDLEALLAEDVPPVALAVAALEALRPAGGAGPFASLGAWRLWGPARQHVRFLMEGEEVGVDVTIAPDGTHRFEAAAGLDLTCAVAQDGAGWRLRAERHQFSARAVRSGATITCFLSGRTCRFTLADPLATTESEAADGDRVLAPMSGLIKRVTARAGAQVAKGEALVVLEAMKMEHTLTAPRDGVLASVPVAEGAQVEEGTLVAALKVADA
ncbi:MAG: acetyl/propionyl/methylcrotonyl-CoA carboxylase subunit alpha [Pseudomonadota bacterium]